MSAHEKEYRQSDANSLLEIVGTKQYTAIITAGNAVGMRVDNGIIIVIAIRYNS